MMIDEQLFSRGRAAFGRTWRGEIWEDDPEVPMGAGYSNDGKPFDIETAAYLKPVMRALRDPNVRKVVALAGVQTLKTFGCIEKPASYFIKHAPGDMALYDCSLDAADDHAKSRLMPYLLGVPAIKAATEAVAAGNRHRITQTDFYLPSMTMRVWPLNENFTQRVTLKYVFISDAFLSGRSGLIGQAIARTTQHPHDCKIVIESQGGEVGDDLDLEWDGTDQRLLHVVCPFCESNQPFLWGLNSERFRPPEFQPVTPKRYTLGYSELEIGWPLPKPLTHAGMIRGDAKYNRSAHEIIEDAVLNETYYECYHCGAHWLDVPDVRRRLDHSSNFVPQKKNRSAKHGFA